MLQKRDDCLKVNILTFEEFLKLFKRIKGRSENFSDEECFEYNERLEYIENYIKDVVRNDISFNMREKSVKLDIMRSEMKIVRKNDIQEEYNDDVLLDLYDSGFSFFSF